MRKMIIGSVVVMACATAMAAGVVTVKVTKPNMVSESDSVSYVGKVQGSHSVKVSARVVGTLWERNGEEGAEVKKGDVLFRIEDTVYKANLKTALAEKAELEAMYKQSQIDAERYISGEAKGGVSKTDRDSAILRRDVAKAKLDAAEASVTLCENDLSYCTITSTIDGVLGTFKYDVGNNVSPVKGELRDVICVDPIDVVVAIPEQQLRWAFENAQMRQEIRRRLLRSDGKEIPIELQVFAIDNKVDSSTGTVTIRFRGANPNREIMPGGYVKLALVEVYKEPQMVVPMSALVFEGDKRFVYMVKDGKAVKREVKLGTMNGNYVFITEGLTADDEFVCSGVHKLFEGAPVMVK